MHGSEKKMETRNDNKKDEWNTDLIYCPFHLHAFCHTYIMWNISYFYQIFIFNLSLLITFFHFLGFIFVVYCHMLEIYGTMCCASLIKRKFIWGGPCDIRYGIFDIPFVKCVKLFHHTHTKALSSLSKGEIFKR